MRLERKTLVNAGCWPAMESDHHLITFNLNKVLEQGVPCGGWRLRPIAPLTLRHARCPGLVGSVCGHIHDFTLRGCENLA